MLAWVNRWALCLFDTSCREKDTGRRFQFPHPTISLKERRRGSAVTSGSPFPPPDQEVAAHYRRIRNECVVYTEKAYSAYGIHAMDRSRLVGSFKW